MSSSSSSSSPSCPKKMITLNSSDGETFEIEEIAAVQSKTLKNRIDENRASTPVPLPDITGKILAKVVEYCTKHAEVGADAESLRAWDAEFVSVDHPTLFYYIGADAEVGADAESLRAWDAEFVSVDHPTLFHYIGADAEVGADAESLRAWDAEFVSVDRPTLFDYILAANSLGIPTLLNLACQSVADMIKGKTPDEIRKILNLKSPSTPEEKEEMRRENQWAFD